MSVLKLGGGYTHVYYIIFFFLYVLEFFLILHLVI